MKVVQIVMDEKTLRAADRAAKRASMNRSQLVRAAVKEYLAARSDRVRDELHRKAYERHPVRPGELDVWETEQVWPED